MSQDNVVLKIENLNKSFTATRAVVDFSLEIYTGEVRGLIGENGSGKSTLASMIAGSLLPDSGKMTKSGTLHAPANMLEGRKNGVSILVQEMGTIDGLSVAENIFLGKEPLFMKAGVVSKKLMVRAAEKLLAEIEAQYIDPRAPVENISFEDRKLLEVAAAIDDNPDILILDETTTALSQKGRDKIYSIIEKFKKQGKTIILISHDLTELMEQCDNITVLRDGCLVQTLTREQISIDKMRSLMIGRDLSGQYYRSDYEQTVSSEVVMSAENIRLGNTLQDVSFELHRGEILGIGGLTDCGMHELCKIIFGVIKADSGRVAVHPDNKTIKNAEDAVRNRIAYIPKNREQEALMISGSIRDNIVLMSFDQLQKGFLISRRRENELAKAQADLLKIKMVSINQLCQFLSGGNKQKVVIGKWLANDSQILIMDCPTRGIDIGVKASIYDLMSQLKKAGKSIIMVSEELPELIGMSDRLVVLKNGRISARFDRHPDLNESTIIREMI